MDKKDNTEEIPINFKKVTKKVIGFDAELRDAIMNIGEDYYDKVMHSNDLNEAEKQAIISYVDHRSGILADKAMSEEAVDKYIDDCRNGVYDEEETDPAAMVASYKSVEPGVFNMPYNVFDINMCITIANVYRMSNRPALICGKIGTGFTVFTSGLTWDSIQDSKKNEMFDLVMYTDGVRITTIACPDDYEKYYLL